MRSRRRQPGVMLDTPVAETARAGLISRACFYLVLLLFGVFGTFGSFLTAFSVPINWGQLAAAAVICSLLCTAAVILPGWKGRLAEGLMALGWSFLLWKMFPETVDAFKRVVNLVSQAYSKASGMELPQFVNLDFIFFDRMEYLFTLLFSLAAFPICWMLAALLIHGRSYLLSFIITLILPAFPIVFGILPAHWALGLLLIMWFSMLLASAAVRRRHPGGNGEERAEGAGAGFLRAQNLILLPAIALCLLLTSLALPPSRQFRPEFLDAARDKAAKALRLPSVFGGGGTLGGNSERVELDGLGGLEFTGKVMLRARADADMKGKIYLKSFAGSVYTGTSWERLDEAAALRASNALDGNSGLSIFPAMAENIPVKETDGLKSASIKVRNVAADLWCVYTPYYLENGFVMPDGVRPVDDGYLQSAWFMGVENYGFVTKPPMTAGYCPDYLTRFGDFVSDAVSDIRLNEGITITLSDGSVVVYQDDDLLANYSSAWMELAVSMNQIYDLNPDLWRASDNIKNIFLEDSGREFVNSLEDYAEFVYDNYTRLPDDVLEGVRECVREQLDIELDGHGIGLKDEERGEYTHFAMNGKRELEYIETIRSWFDSEFEYTLNPGVTPKGKEFVTYFLGESHTGYCVHFASAATAMLRAAGIPARYAEGYVVPWEGKGRWIDVPDYNAHAWVEVWFGGMGWIPVEVTPAVPAAPAAYANGRLPEGVSPEDMYHTGKDVHKVNQGVDAPPSLESIPTPTPSPTPATGLGYDEFWNTYNHRDGRLLHLEWLLIPGAPILLLASVLLQREFRLYRRRQNFSQRDRNRAALCVYGLIVRLHRAAVSIPGIPASPPEELHLLALKARFSAHVLEEDEVRRLTAHVKETQKALSETLTGAKRLFAKYILVLF